jgi:hypothetical protein
MFLDLNAVKKLPKIINTASHAEDKISKDKKNLEFHNFVDDYLTKF